MTKWGNLYFPFSNTCLQLCLCQIPIVRPLAVPGRTRPRVVSSGARDALPRGGGSARAAGSAGSTGAGLAPVHRHLGAMPAEEEKRMKVNKWLILSSPNFSPFSSIREKTKVGVFSLSYSPPPLFRPRDYLRRKKRSGKRLTFFLSSSIVD